MTKIIIDNETGRILDEAIHALPRHSQRMAAYDAALDGLLDIRSAPEPGGPWCGLSVEERIECMTAAKTGGAFADALAMQERGYAVGHIPG